AVPRRPVLAAAQAREIVFHCTVRDSTSHRLGVSSPQISRVVPRYYAVPVVNVQSTSRKEKVEGSAKEPWTRETVHNRQEPMGSFAVHHQARRERVRCKGENPRSSTSLRKSTPAQSGRRLACRNTCWQTATTHPCMPLPRSGWWTR